jgi:AcrR family transcriptional regulator
MTTSVKTKAKTKRSKPARRRKQGRPKTDSSTVGRDAIVEAARVLLRTVPPGRVTRLAVAKAAGVDPALVRYYFGDITPLLREVAISVMMRMRSELDASSALTLSPAERLRKRVNVYLQAFSDNPHFHQLVVDLLLNGQEAEVRSIRKSITKRSFAELEDILRAISGRNESPINAKFVYLSLFGVLEFFVTGRPLLEELYPAHLIGSRRLQEEYADFVSTLFLHAIESAAKR